MSRKPEWHRVVENASRFLSQKPVPRDPAEAHAWLKQLASEMLAAQEKTLEAFRLATKPALREHQRRSQALRNIGRRDYPSRVPVAQWVEPFEPWVVSPQLVKWFTDAVKACDPEELTKGKRLDVALGFIRALGLERPRGRPRGKGKGPQNAIRIYNLRKEGASWIETAGRLNIEDKGVGAARGGNVRSAQRNYQAHPDAIIRHLISLGPSIPRGYELKDGKLIVNEREAAIVRMLFERYAQLGSAPAPKRALAALMRKLRIEGITDERGKPIDKAYLYKVLNNRLYIGAPVHKYGEHEAIIDRALWREVHGVRRGLTAPRRRSKRAQKTTLNTRI
jgi:hypothetical protein